LFYTSKQDCNVTSSSVYFLILCLTSNFFVLSCFITGLTNNNFQYLSFIISCLHDGQRLGNISVLTCHWTPFIAQYSWYLDVIFLHPFRCYEKYFVRTHVLHACYMHALSHPPSFDQIPIFIKEYIAVKLLVIQLFLLPPLYSCLVTAHISDSNLCPNNFSLCASPKGCD
jgi:hypothetical protein